MSTVSPAANASAPAARPETTTPGFGRAIELTTRAATSWVGLLTAYAGAVTAAVFAFQKLAEPLKNEPWWLRAIIVSAFPLLAFIFQAIPALIEQRRKKRLTEISGHLRSGYFRLAPWEEEASFARADGKHEEILRWLRQPDRAVLYLTGLSGSGKSSLLAAWVLPNLERQNTLVIRSRGYQNPVAVLERELQTPGVVWQKPPTEIGDLRSLLERACRFVRPRRLLIVLDQFEEFVILQDADQQNRFEQLLSSLREQPVDGLSLLLVFRSDYIGLIEKLALPPLVQDTNWKEVPPFTENAAREFMRGSGLEVSDELLRDVLREAAEIEQTKGIIRPVTINLCGLVLGRFATGLPRGFRPGGLIRGFLRESIFLPSVRDIAPGVIPHLITSYVTKHPRKVAELARDAALDPAAVRGCLRVLGQSDRAIVRPLDEDQQTWEISHDFLVPLLDSIMSRWRMSVWRRCRSWLPWAAAVMMVAAVLVASTWRRDPVLELEDLGWHVHKIGDALEVDFEGVPPKKSLAELQRISTDLHVKMTSLDSSIAEWRVLKNLSALDVSGPGLGELLSPAALTEIAAGRAPFPSRPDINNLTPLQGLKSLRRLNLARTKVVDISPLTALSSLAVLDLSFTPVSDISPLKNLTSLNELDLTFTHVSDVSALENLKNLSELHYGNTPGSDLSQLRNMEGLSTLDLTGKPVTNASLKDLPVRVSKLSLGSTGISDLSALTALTGLADLDLGATKVIDISPLSRLKNLSKLNLGGTKVSDVSPLRDLQKLSKLNVRGTKVQDVSMLSKNVHLE